MVLLVVCWRYRMPFDANGCVFTLVNGYWIKWMYFYVNEFGVGINDRIFSGSEQQKVYRWGDIASSLPIWIFRRHMLEISKQLMLTLFQEDIGVVVKVIMCTKFNYNDCLSSFQCLTMDMGGSASTSDFVQAVISNIHWKSGHFSSFRLMPNEILRLEILENKRCFR